MNVPLRLTGVLISLLIPTLLLWQFLRLESRAASGPTADLSLPSQVGPWTAAEDRHLRHEVLAIIEPDAHLLRRYEAPGRVPIWTYVGLYGGRAGYGKGAHDPKICYPSQGWEILRSNSLNLSLDGAGRLHAKLLKVHLGNAEQAVIYWFQPAGRWPASSALEELLRVLDTVLGRPQYAFVRLAAPSDGSPSAERDVAEFAGLFAPAVRAAVDRLR